ncbi:MAG TPA: CBS domain-containing protein [Bryobacteraceae bacterium]|nr:CBS domain-containing protein [Bryobacteraceae bacterium]
MSRVKDLIQNRVMCAVEEGQTVAEVLRHMAEINVGAIMVLRDGELRGVFSERDLMVRVVLAGLDPSATPVEQVMSTNLATVTEEATPDEAMERMRGHCCRHLPVVRGAQVVGFLSMRDLMNYQLERQTEELHQMTAYIHGTV